VAECAEHLTSEADTTVASGWYEALKKALLIIQKTPEIGHLRKELPVRGIRTLNLRKYPKY
jgi:hypothetical protein